MKLLISNQHGAIVMALMPFLYGMLLSHPIWQHIFFLLAWVSLYLMTYPFLNLFKGRNLELYIKWSWIYFFACVIFAIPVLIYNWHTVLFVAAMLPFVLISIYYVKQKDERAFLNDLAGIVIFAIAGMGSSLQGRRVTIFTSTNVFSPILDIREKTFFNFSTNEQIRIRSY